MTLRTLIATLLLSTAAVAMLAWLVRPEHSPMVSLAQLERPSALSTLEQPLPLPEIELTTHRGELITQKSFNAHWTLLFAGYSHCVDICTPALSQLSNALEILSNTPSSQPSVGVFLSLDSKRDDSERLAKYLKYFSPKITGLSGSQQAIDHFTSQVGLLYQTTENPQNPQNITIGHSGEIFVINPQAEVVAVITPPLNANTIADFMHTIIATQSRTTSTGH